MSEFLRFYPLRSLRATWPLIAIPILISLIGIVTIHPFNGTESLAPRQLVWLFVAIALYITCAITDMRFIRRTPVLISGYFGILSLLVLLFLVADPNSGAKSWFDFGLFAFQPSDFAKIILIAILAKYFSRRHIEIQHFRHIMVSAIYAGIPILLVLFEPDLGTAVILCMVWFGMILVSGVSKKHIALVFGLGLACALLLWFGGGLEPHQRERIITFINPAADIRGTGYNAFQATVATGSGEMFGKGIGHGTQSKLLFLPEYETDFIFAAFAEEWGFVGVVILLSLYGILLFQLLSIARRSATNFDTLFTLGVAILIISHVTIHAGINVGLLPVTGTTIPFMSSGGSHLVMEFIALGIVASLSQQGRSVSREASLQEYEG